jgi:hypothetical protein
MEKLFAFFGRLPPDKALHALGGILMFAVGNLHSLLAAAILVVADAILKEVYDSFHSDKHTCDPYDALATCGGGLLGFLCVVPGIFHVVI